MALKKPSDFFGKNKKTHLDEVKESYDSARPEKIEQVSEAFGTFKENLNHIQSLSDFTSTFDSFKENLEKVETVSSEVSSIKNEIKTLIKKEEKWKLLADCIRSGQVETRELLQEFDKDPEFKAWYTAQFLQD